MTRSCLTAVLLVCTGACSTGGTTDARSTVEQGAVHKPPPREANQATPKARDWSTFASTSVRNTNDGSLEGGVLLPGDAQGLRLNPKRNRATQYGTVETVRGLVEAAETVHQELGGVGVTVHDLSYEGGGPIPHHGSHQNGRDVDVLFYQTGPDGTSVDAVGAFFDPKGHGVDFRDLANPEDDIALRIDLPRTWRFVQALIEDERASLQRIYVAEHIRSLLMAHATTQGAPGDVITRFSEMTCQPSYPHDDHFHFRFFCTAEDIKAGCRDADPMYPWRRAQLTEAGVAPLPELPRRPQAKAEVVTHDEARAAAGPLHADVEGWLDARMQWTKKPSPGRPYCP